MLAMLIAESLSKVVGVITTKFSVSLLGSGSGSSVHSVGSIGNIGTMGSIGSFSKGSNSGYSGKGCGSKLEECLLGLIDECGDSGSSCPKVDTIISVNCFILC